ncbi:MAG: metalloregulator ArsR/SmtB family transcription factor [Bacteroidia bacterium]|nr:metalloregulator ArsR/SmtB family transcription factor [Bacteroidia bacterium]
MSTIPSTALRNDTAKLKRVARVMKTISHPARLAIVELLLEQGPLSVKTIYESIGISQSNASQHLKALEDVEVLISERDGKQILYRVLNPTVPRLLDCVQECVDC